MIELKNTLSLVNCVIDFSGLVPITSAVLRSAVA